MALQDFPAIEALIEADMAGKGIAMSIPRADGKARKHKDKPITLEALSKFPLAPFNVRSCRACRDHGSANKPLLPTDPTLIRLHSVWN